MKRIFLLGGYDLEMMTIRDLLEQHHEEYYDKHLQWENAYLDAYQDELIRFGNQMDIQIYGIELRHTGESNYANYSLIDHHNHFSAQPSSLLQVVTLLNIPVTRHQQLVAANDSGYIPAMKELYASEEEIRTIRQADRKAQGVTENEEQLAELSIRDHLLKIGNVTVVQTQISHFSPICDRLYPCTSLLIYTDHEWMFYGEGCEKIKVQVKKDITQDRIFYGGGKNGFIGTSWDAFTPEEIKQMKDLILTLINT